MVSDRREYIRVDVGYFDNPKVADALDASPFAPLLHLASMAYARQHRTDGAVPIKRMLRKVGATENDARILLEAGLWTDARDGYVQVHDYAKHQETRADIERRSNAGKKANRVRWNSNPIPVGSEPDSESDPIGNPEERRGEESTAGARAEAAEAIANTPPGQFMNGNAVLAAHGMSQDEIPLFVRALRDGGITSWSAYVSSAHHKGTLDGRIQDWRTETSAGERRRPGSSFWDNDVTGKGRR